MERLEALRGEARALAEDVRAIAFALERDPDALRRRPDLPAVATMATFGIPPEHNPAPLTSGPHRFYGDRSIELAIMMEEIAASDVAAVFALPGPALSGIPILDLGSRRQRERYYGQLVAEPTCTFFALTEPARGSNAGELETSLAPDGDGLSLRGVKRYVSNGARARLGVVLARRHAGPLGIVAVLVDTSAPGFRARALPTVGLRGAQLTELTFDGMRVGADDVLGAHLPATRRGMLAVVRMFNRSRPMVAAMGVGLARAGLDYVHEHRPQLRGSQRAALDALGRRLAAVRSLVHRAAAAVDRDPADGYLASAAKARAAAVAQDATRVAPTLLGPGARLQHPVLDKLARDAMGFEFMEGTTNLQKLTLFQGYHRGAVCSAYRYQEDRR
jgi:alkylation response protein AidB-like acyl-CoA dehydrogenase